MVIQSQAGQGASQLLDFDLRSGEVQFQTFLAEPLFGLFLDYPGLIQHLFGRLSRHGLKLADIKLESGAVTFAEVQLTCSLLAYSAVLRIRLDNIEVYCFNVRSITKEQLGDVVVGVLEAVKLHVPTTEFKLYTFSTSLHGVVTGTSGAQFLAAYTHPPKLALGPLTGSGVVFYYGETNERTRSALTIDLSGLIENGLLVRPSVVWDASKVPVRSLPALAAVFTEDALRQLGLTLR